LKKIFAVQQSLNAAPGGGLKAQQKTLFAGGDPKRAGKPHLSSLLDGGKKSTNSTTAFAKKQLASESSETPVSSIAKATSSVVTPSVSMHGSSEFETPSRIRDVDAELSRDITRVFFNWTRFWSKKMSKNR